MSYKRSYNCLQYKECTKFHSEQVHGGVAFVNQAVGLLEDSEVRKSLASGQSLLLRGLRGESRRHCWQMLADAGRCWQMLAGGAFSASSFRWTGGRELCKCTVLPLLVDHEFCP